MALGRLLGEGLVILRLALVSHEPDELPDFEPQGFLHRLVHACIGDHVVAEDGLKGRVHPEAVKAIFALRVDRRAPIKLGLHDTGAAALESIESGCGTQG